MAATSFTVKDFSGGLNLSASPESLPSSQTPDCSNVDMLESGIIKSRRGWVLSVPEAFTDKPIRALHRHYPSTGSNAWFTIADGTLWSYDGATQAWSQVEAETLITDGPYTVVSNPSYSGGSYAEASGDVTLTTPVCSRFILALQSLDALVSVDDGEFESVTGGSFDSGTLTSQVHTVVVRPSALPYSGELDGKVSRTVGRGVTHTIAYYDDGVTNGLAAYVGVSSGGYQYGHAGIYLDTGGVVRFAKTDSGSWFASVQTIRTSTFATAVRTVGWHVVSFTVSENVNTVFTIVLDGTTYTYTRSSGTTGGTTTLTLASTDYTNYNTVYFDEYYANGVLVDDFRTASQWTLAAGTLTPSNARAYDTLSLVGIDTFSYIDGTLWDDKSTAPSDTDEQFGFLTVGDKVYYASANTALRVYNGSTDAAVSSGPKGAYMVEHKGRIFITGAAGDSSLMQASNSTNVEEWTGQYAWSGRLMAKDAGHIATGLKLWNDRIYQFTTAGLFSLECVQIADPTTWKAKVLSTRYGCIAPRSIATAPNSMVWLGSDAVYTYGELPGVNPLDGAGFGRISDDIEPLLRGLSESALDKAVGVIYRSKYWLAIDADGTGVNSTILVYRFPTEKRAGAWTRYDYAGLDITTLLTVRGDETGLFAGTSTGSIGQLDTGGSDNGAAITFRYTMPRLAAGGFESVKHTRAMHLGATSTTLQNVTVSMQTDDISPTPQTVSITPTTGAQPVRILMTSRGRSVQPSFESSGRNQDLAIQSATITYTVSPIR